jgi:hypothetical protein
VLEVASEIKGIDPDSTSAEHETARDRWKAVIILLKVAAAARAMEMEAAEKANAHALGAANTRMQSSIIWLVGGVAFVMVLALIFLSCLVHDIRPGQPSHCNFPSPTLD